MQETEMATLSAPLLRYREASYFYSQFIAHSGPPHDSYFHMVSYFDSFLFALTSVEEMVGKATKTTLREIEIFRFIKALRNITMHHSVLAAPQPGAKFLRPFNRHITDPLGNSSAKLAINFGIFRAIFDAIEADWPREKPTLDIARAYLLKLETKPQPVFLDQILDDALQAVAGVVA